MALQDVLVHMDATPHCAVRLDAAIALAGKQGARITGLHVLTHVPYASRSSGSDSQAEAAEALFRDRTASAGVPAEWLSADCQVVGVTLAEVIVRHAYCSDMVVVSQSPPDATGAGEADLPERLVLGAGRPVLVVPYAGNFPRIGEHVMVAWKEGREATRALHDALPLLRKARRVTLVTATEKKSRAKVPVVVSDAGKIVTHLRNHGVPVSSEHLRSQGLSVGDVLLNTVADEGADLLVTGAFGYNSQGAPVLGSVARHLLLCMTVPVLFSH